MGSIFRKILAGLLIIGFGAVLFFAYQKVKDISEPSKTASDIIPNTAIAILETDNLPELWKDLAHTSLIWENLEALPFYKKTDQSGHTLDSLLLSNAELKTIFKEHQFCLALFLNSKGQKEYLYTFSSEMGSDEIHSLINQQLPISKKGSRSFQDKNITNYTVLNAGFFITEIEGVLALSRSESLIEKTIQDNAAGQVSGESELFQKIHQTRGTNNKLHGHLYVNFNYLSKWISPYSHEDHTKTANLFNRYASWGELDIQIQPNNFYLNGITLSKDSAQWVNLFNTQSEGSGNAAYFLPENVDGFISLMVNDKNSFLRKIHRNDYSALQEEIQNNNDRFGIDLNNDLLSWMGVEMISFSYRNQHFVAIQTDPGMESPEPLLQSLSYQIADYFEAPMDTLTVKGQHIQAIKMPITTRQLFGQLFPEDEEMAFTVFNEYVLFGPDPSAVRDFIYGQDKGTLANNVNYDAFINQHFSSSYNMLAYLQIGKGIDFIRQFLKTDLQEDLSSYEEQFLNFEAIGYQVTATNNSYFNNLALKYNPTQKEEDLSLWEYLAESGIKSQPHLIYNHRSKTNDIIYQDTSNNLVLISNTGKLKWKKDLGGTMLDQPHQIDVYNNGKLQLLVNTRNKLHLVDILGRDVKGFPVDLKNSATGPLAVFDYNNDHDYRIFIPESDNRLHNYDKEGKIVGGWESIKTNSPIYRDPRHLRIGNKDYIYVHDSSGQVFLLNRKGAVRYESKINITNRSNNPAYVEKGNAIETSRVIYTDSSGRIYKSNFGGLKDSLKPMETIGKSFFFDYADINGDGSKDYILASGNQLQTYSKDGSLLFKYTSDFPITSRPDHFIITEQKGFIVLNNRGSGEAVLLNNLGTPVGEIPQGEVRYITVGDLNLDNVIEVLVTTKSNKVITFNLD